MQILFDLSLEPAAVETTLELLRIEPHACGMFHQGRPVQLALVFEQPSCTVRYGGSAAAGATVTFTMKKADGRMVTGTATANKKGQTVWSYRVGTNDPAGTYSVTSTAGYNSKTASSTTVNFTVQ